MGNGEELNAIRGARALLSRREVCSVLVHVFKAKRGWADEAAEPDVRSSDAPDGASGRFFSTELWGLLSNVGGLEVSLHLDEDLTNQVNKNDPRVRPSTRQIRSATELDSVFREEASPHD